jgi:hypothetical protein
MVEATATKTISPEGRQEPTPQDQQAAAVAVAPAAPAAPVTEADPLPCKLALNGVMESIKRLDTAKDTLQQVATELSDLRIALDAKSPDAFLDAMIEGVRVPLTSKLALLAKRAELSRACEEVRERVDDMMQHQTNLIAAAHLPEPEEEQEAQHETIIQDDRFGSSDTLDSLAQDVANAAAQSVAKDRQAAARPASAPAPRTPYAPAPRPSAPPRDGLRPVVIRDERQEDQEGEATLRRIWPPETGHRSRVVAG